MHPWLCMASWCYRFLSLCFNHLTRSGEHQISIRSFLFQSLSLFLCSFSVGVFLFRPSIPGF
jgi:hypothetical protein